MKVALITNVIPSYRNSFYSWLFATTDHEITIFCQPSLPGINVKIINEQFASHIINVSFWGSERNGLIWQRLPFRFLLNNFDAYVLLGNPRVISMVWISLLLKLRHKPVVIWSLIRPAQANRLYTRLKLAWWSLFGYFLVYTEQEAAFLKQYWSGRKVVIRSINNGLDQQKIEETASMYTCDKLQQWRSKQQLGEKRVLLSVARLVPKNEFTLMIRSMSLLVPHFPNLVWCLIGDGELRQELEDTTHKYQMQDHIRFCGAIYDETMLAPYFLSSELFVHPGAIGLSLFHAFGYGLPVVTHGNAERHMPEFGAFQPHETGLLFKEGDAEDLAKCIMQLLNDRANLAVYGQNAQKIVREQHNSSVMVKRFTEILAIIQANSSVEG